MARCTPCSLSAENTITAKEIIARYPRPKSALIPLLHLAQEQDGYVAEDAMAHIAELIGVTPAEVLGTCSFYEMFKREPVGEYLVNVCTNISCMLLGGEELLHHLEDRLGIKSGSTTPDGTFTIEDVECIAACTEAPCLQVNYRYFYKVTPDDADALIDDLRHGRRAHEVPEARRPRPHPPAAAARPARRQRRARPVPRSPCGSAPPRRGGRPRDSPTPSRSSPRAFDLEDGHTLDRYLATGGYEGLKAALAKAPTAVGDEVKAASLLGRGGAGFPAGTKWGFCPPGVWPRYLVVNGDESEPGTYKDRLLMEKDPHQLIEGVLIACYAIGAAQAFLYVRGEMALAQERIAQALNDAYAAGYIGKNILGTDFSVDVVLHWGAGAYIVGEETALIESLEGNRGMPRLKPPFFPAAKGLYLQPTVVNNVETLANLPWILNNGGAKFAELGAETSKGMRVFAVSGHVQQPRRVRGGVRRHHLPRPHLRARVRRRHARRQRAEGVHPRRRVGAVVLRGAPRPAAREGDRRPGRLDARLRRDRRDGRHHRRGEGVLAARAVLRPRVVRQVHAVPRGHQLAGEDPAPHARRPRPSRRRRPAARRVRQHQPRDRLAAEGRPRSARSGPSAVSPIASAVVRFKDEFAALLRRLRRAHPSPINGKAYVPDQPHVEVAGV